MNAARAVLAVTLLAAARGVQILGDGSATRRASLRSRRGTFLMPEEAQLDARAVGDDIDTLAEDGSEGLVINATDGVVINATEGSVAFAKWYGRLGNNIVQLVNAILFCQVEGFSTLRIPDAIKRPLHHSSSMASDVFDLPKEIKITPRPDLKLGCNFRKMKLFFGRCLAVTKSLFRETAAQHLFPLMSGVWRGACQNESAQQNASRFNGLTIHLRSGDSRRDLNLDQFSYASCSFFKKVMSVHGYKSVRVITEKDKSHPCIQVLRDELGSKLAVQSGSLEEDSCAIMHARHLAVGSWSTFSQVLELFNDHLETNFWPVPRRTDQLLKKVVCNPVVIGSPVTYVYQVDGMQDGYNRMDSERSVDYFGRLPLEKVTLQSVCDEESEAPFMGSVRLLV